MFKRHSVVLTCGTALVACVCAGGGDLPPASARGTFVQRKVLADVGVTLTSKGTFDFRRGESFTWKVTEPVESEFFATPSNYVFTAGGRSSTHRLDVDVSSIERLFAIKEVKEFIRDLKVEGTAGAFPTGVKVWFRNGDRLEIDLKGTNP